MFKLSINIAFLTLLITPIAFCFLILIKYVINDISVKNTVKKHNTHHREYIKEDTVPQLRIVK